MKPRKQEYKQRTRSKPEEYDLLVLGSGTAGKLIAWTLAQKGMKTASIEPKYVGGSCQNIACLPSKNVIQSAKVASYFRRSEEFGITKANITGSMSLPSSCPACGNGERIFPQVFRVSDFRTYK